MSIDKLHYKDFVHLDKHLDDIAPITGSVSKDFESKIPEKEREQILEDYSTLRGKLQYIFGDISISHKQIAELVALAEDPGKMAIREAQKMEKVRKAERSNVIMKILNVVVFVALIALGIFYFTKNSNQEEFRPLDYLGWETEAFEYDPEGRLDFPLASLEEIKNFFQSYKNLGFAPITVMPTRQSLKVRGATVIDYEPRKVAVVIYNDQARSDDIVALYSFKGRMNTLPKSEKGNFDGLIYQTYASDKYNIVAWEADDETVGLVVGRMSAQDLAEFAKKSSK